ncbi:MAG: DUF4097 family beta strand repeat-containing protein [Planctomycetota bacterium]
MNVYFTGRGFAGVALLALWTLGGCAKGASVWASRQDHFEIAVESATQVVATTHDGTQTVVGVEDSGGKVKVDANVRGGGVSRSDAQAALDAIAVAVERQGETIDVSWDWKTAKSPAWSADVDFEIKLPPRTNVKLVTHNGPVVAQGIEGECLLETRNGRITAQSTGPRLDATTHNGDLDITTSAADVALDTYNGGIAARLNATGDVGGSIVSHNGGIVVVLAGTAAAALECSTANGHIHCDHNLEQALMTQTSLKGSIRGGKKTLRIQTQNGSIKIQ